MINIFVEFSAACLADATAVPITFAISMDDLISFIRLFYFIKGRVQR
jgi:hypothetical protein